MRKSLHVKKGHRRISVPLNDIIFLEKQKRKIIAHLRNGDVDFYGKFDEIEGYLDDRFVHPHRSYVLNMDYILRLGLSEIVLEDGNVICMGKKCFERCAKSFDMYVTKKVANTRFL